MIKYEQILTEIEKYQKVDFIDGVLEDHLIAANNSTDKEIEQKYFAIIKKNSYPVVLDLICDNKLAKNLAEKYESVSPSKNIDPKNWIQIICSGQLSDQELFDLIRLAFDKTSF